MHAVASDSCSLTRGRGTEPESDNPPREISAADHARGLRNNSCHGSSCGSLALAAAGSVSKTIIPGSRQRLSRRADELGLSFDPGVYTTGPR